MTDQTARSPRVRRPPAPVTVAGMLAVVAVMLVTASTYFLFATRQHTAAQAQREDVMTAARQEAVNLTSQDYATIDRDLARMIGGTTGDLREDLRKQRTTYRDTFVRNKLRAQGNATEAGALPVRPDPGALRRRGRPGHHAGPGGHRVGGDRSGGPDGR